jgi:heptosyltransferase-2
MQSQESVIVRGRPRRILVRGTNWIGDSVMSMPAVQCLREMDPQAYIAMLCPLKLHDLWRHNPFLDRVILFDQRTNPDLLRAEKFDVAVIFPNSFRSAWECWRAGVPARVGFGGRARRALLTHVVKEPLGDRPRYKKLTVAGKSFSVKTYSSIRHQAYRYLDLIAAIGGNAKYVAPKIYLAFHEFSPASKFFRNDGRPLLGLNAGAEYGPAKRWMSDRFAEVAKRVARQVECRWILFGGPADVELTSAIEAALGDGDSGEDSVMNLAGKTTLLELCQLLKSCRVFLTNDTGPMHIAAALGTRVVSIWGSTSPELTGPLSNNAVVIQHKVECNPCFLRECPIDFRCMSSVSVDEVADAVLKNL